MSRPGQQLDAERAQQLLGQALRAQASGAQTSKPPVPPVERHELPMSWYLVLALLVGALLGVGLALLSMLAPGVLPAIG